MSPSPAAFPLLCQASARKIPRQFSNWQWWFRPSMRRRNVRPLIESLFHTLASIEWEAIFVDDDSLDGTAALIREVGRLNRRVRVIQRIGRHGLASACIEGMLATPARYLGAMDTGSKHDESILPIMLDRITAEK